MLSGAIQAQLNLQRCPMRDKLFATLWGFKSLCTVLKTRQVFFNKAGDL